MALEEMQAEICGLSEVRRAGTGSTIDGGYAYFWSGSPAGEKDWIGGVGLAFRLSCLQRMQLTLEDVTTVFSTPRIMVVKLKRTQKSLPTTIVIGYAPTSSAEEEEKDDFYDSLAKALTLCEDTEQVWCMGDFNGRVGCQAQNWPNGLGPDGARGENKGGVSLLEFCSTWKLRITNTFFKLPRYLPGSWKDNRSKTWRCLDYFLVRQRDAAVVRSVTAKRRALEWSDHCLISADVRMKAVQWQTRKEKPSLRRRRRINVRERWKLSVRKKSHELAAEKITECKDNGVEALHEGLYTADVESMGATNRTSPDWFVENEGVLLPLIQAKSEAAKQWRLHPSADARNLMLSVTILANSLQICC